MEIAGIVAVAERDRRRLELLCIDEAHVERNLFGAAHLEALALLQRANEFGGLDQAFRRSGVEPGVATSEQLDRQRAALEIDAIDVGDFELATCRGLEIGGDVDDLRIVEVEPGYRPIRFGPSRLFLD